MARLTKQFTEPQLSPKKPKPSDMHKTWRVWFRFFNSQTSKYVIISRKGDINSITDFRERIAQANALVSLLKARLQNGWDPISNTYPAKTSKELELERLKELTFLSALDFAYDKKAKDCSHKTKQDYSSLVKYLKKAAVRLDLACKKISLFTRPEYKLLLEEVTDMRGLDGNGYNKYRTALSLLLAELIQWDIVPYNFVRDIKQKKVAKSFAHRPPTQDQRMLIVAAIKEQCWPYYRFVSVEYGCGIRPKEITRLRIKHLHKLEGVFRLTKDITKNGEEREVAIPNWVMDLLSELNLHAYSPEDFIFSGGSHTQMFLPGKKQISPNTPTSYWKRIVKEKKEKGGLGLDINQYSIKKLSGDDMVRLQRREGASGLLDLAQHQFGHASKEQTEVYTREHIEVMKEIIKEKMPQL